jgi:hypothetical protein
MNAIAFDTLKFAKRLKEAGFSEAQAEGLATAGAEFIEDNLATKRDLKELEAALRAEIKQLDVKIEQFHSDLQRDMKELEINLQRDMKGLEISLKRDSKDLEYRMIIKLGTLMVVAVSAMAALTKLL